MKNFSHTALILLACLTFLVCPAYGCLNPVGFKSFIKSPNIVNTSNTGYVSIEKFGARAGDKTFDNAPVIMKALKSANKLIIPANKIFYTKSPITISNLSGRVISAYGSTLINLNYNVRTFLFTNCNQIKIIGGYFTRDILPTVQNGNEQSTIGFKNCKNVTVTNCHINRSPEMGIDNNVVIGGTFTNNTIEHCLRDGIYAHYSANLKYIGNTLNEIKDDALSIHDYGLDSQKSMLHSAGYQQAGHSEISLNKINNCIQGISSIGCTDILISKNKINNTVLAAICIFNSEDLYPNSTARVKQVTVRDNTLTNTNYGLLINGLKQSNNGQISSGRAAIFIACIKQGKPFTMSKMRLSSIILLNNIVTNSAVNGVTLYNIDALVCKGNRFINCHSDTMTNPEYTGDIVEVINCTKIDVSKNDIIDSRKVPLHERAYKFENSSGIFKKQINKGFLIEDSEVIDSKLRTH